MTNLISNILFFLSFAFCLNVSAESVINSKILDEADFFSKGYGLHTHSAKVISEQELQSLLNNLVADFNRSRPHETVTIYVRAAITNELDSSKDLYVSFGDCYSTEEGLYISYVKCTEQIKYKHVYISADPKGILNEYIGVFRVKVPSEKMTVPVVRTEVMRTDLGLAVIKDEELMNNMRELYPRQQCNVLKRYGYKPTFSASDKAVIAKCLNLN